MTASSIISWVALEFSMSFPPVKELSNSPFTISVEFLLVNQKQIHLIKTSEKSGDRGTITGPSHLKLKLDICLGQFL